MLQGADVGPALTLSHCFRALLAGLLLGIEAELPWLAQLADVGVPLHNHVPLLTGQHLDFETDCWYVMV